MTEAEWDACADPTPMLELLRNASERKLRLFACSCCRRVWPLLNNQRSRQAIEIAERHADGFVSDEQLKLASALAVEAFRSIPSAPNGMAGAAKLAASAVWGATAMAGEESIFGGEPLVGFAVNTALQAGDSVDEPEAERAAQVGLMRDIFGNTFHSVPIDPAWPTWNDGAVRKLAQTIYDHRAFDRLPLLADALEEAGCTEPAILNHCRVPGEHVRGCWVIDLLTGRE